jgi:hypothetical protein
MVIEAPPLSSSVLLESFAPCPAPSVSETVPSTSNRCNSAGREDAQTAALRDCEKTAVFSSSCLLWICASWALRKSRVQRSIAREPATSLLVRGE